MEVVEAHSIMGLDIEACKTPGSVEAEGLWDKET